MEDIEVTMRIIGIDGHNSVLLPMMPFPGMVILNSRNEKFRITEVICIADHIKRTCVRLDPFGNAISVLVEPIK